MGIPEGDFLSPNVYIDVVATNAAVLVRATGRLKRLAKASKELLSAHYTTRVAAILASELSESVDSLEKEITLMRYELDAVENVFLKTPEVVID